jgi:hypothetical protein
MTESRIYRYPNKDFDKHRLWVRFKRLDFEWNEAEGRMLGTAGPQQPAIYLYLPGSIELKDGSSYSTDQLGVLGRATEFALGEAGLNTTNAAERLQAAVDSLAGAAVDTIETASDLVTGAEAVNPGMVALMMKRFGGPLPGGVRNGVSSALRTTANPHQRALFESVNLRAFSFAFEFVPDNEKEAIQQQEIVKFFRKLAYPTLHDFEGATPRGIPDDLANQLVYKFPSMVMVDMMYSLYEETIEQFNGLIQHDADAAEDIFRSQGQNQDDVMSSGMWRVGPKIQPCYVTDVAQTLDNNNSMAYRPIAIQGDDSIGYHALPTTSTLSVSLQEDRPLSSASIDEGY